MGKWMDVTNYSHTTKDGYPRDWRVSAIFLLRFYNV